MNARNFSIKPVACAALLAACLASAGAHAEGLYVGGSLGTPQYNDAVNGIVGAGSGVSGKIFGGYQLSPNFALEGGIASLGHIDNANGSVRGHGEYLDAIGLLPLGAHVSLLGSVGLAHVNLDTSNGDDKGMGLKLGLGAEYAISRNLALRAEYENYHPAEFGTHPSIGQYTVGFKVGF